MNINHMLMRHFWPNMVVCPCPGGKCMNISALIKIFIETTWPIEAKFHMDHSYEMRTKVHVCIKNNPGHMTKMATVAIHSKNL